MTKTNPRAVQQEPGDQKILERYRAGDIDAVGDLADLYASRLYNFGLRMCGDSQDAQDMVQDTLLNTIKYLKGFRGETKLKNWLYRLASTACLRRRRGKNNPDHELSLEDTRPDSQEGPNPDIPDWSTSPAEELMTSELREHLTNAIGLLPEKYRLVFNLRDLEGFSTEETAEILDLSPQNVKTRLHRARAFLRNNLVDYYREDTPSKRRKT